MRKPKVPRRPKEPTEPSNTVLVDVLIMDSGSELRADLLQETILEIASSYQETYGYIFEKDSLSLENIVFSLPEHENECYNCYCYTHGSCEGLHAKIKATNPNYDNLMKKYKNAYSRWETKMEEYEEKMSRYNIDIKLWEKEQEPKREAKAKKEKARLEREINRMQKELEKLT